MVEQFFLVQNMRLVLLVVGRVDLEVLHDFPDLNAISPFFKFVPFTSIKSNLSLSASCSASVDLPVPGVPVIRILGLCLVAGVDISGNLQR